MATNDTAVRLRSSHDLLSAQKKDAEPSHRPSGPRQGASRSGTWPASLAGRGFRCLLSGIQELMEISSGWRFRMKQYLTLVASFKLYGWPPCGRLRKLLRVRWFRYARRDTGTAPNLDNHKTECNVPPHGIVWRTVAYGVVVMRSA